MKSLPLIRLLGACLVLIAVTASSAQVPATTQPIAPDPASASLNRRIEVLIRSQFSVRPDYDMVLGARTPSDTAGYDNLPVTFIRNDKQTTVNFLISKDGNTLARVEKFSIDNNPALAIDVDKRPVRGSAAAKVEIINFDDLECPYCGMLNSEILPQTMDHYKGLIKIVYKDYPLPGHPWARRAAVDGCACPTSPRSRSLALRTNRLLSSFRPRLAGLGIDRAALIAAIEAPNAVSPAGTLETGDETLRLRVSGAFNSEQDLAAINIATNGRLLRLSDIADIRRVFVDPPQPDFPH